MLNVFCKAVSSIFAAVGLIFFFVSPVRAAKEPRALQSDSRIKQVIYDPNQIVEIVGTYGYETTIEFAMDEYVIGETFGDSIAWQTLKKFNHLYIKPVEPNAVGNMTVVTNKRTYFFNLNSSVDDMTLVVRFKYPAMLTETSPDIRPDQQVAKNKTSTNPLHINLNYASAGHKSDIQLSRVFDDGEFTYFQFDPRTEIPAFYLVGDDGTESNVNVHREGAYMVAERVARRFTLRNGDAHLCVENDGWNRQDI